MAFNSWHLKDLEKYEGHQENLADLFSSATDDPNCRIVNGKGFFIGRGRTERWTIERERTESGKWLYVIVLFLLLGHLDISLKRYD